MRTMGDGTYAGWQAWTDSAPAIWAYGPSWTTAQIAALKTAWPLTTVLAIDNSGTNFNANVLDVETKYVTSSQVVASWINGRLNNVGPYALSRPTIYLNSNGLYYYGATDDIFLGAGINAGFGILSHYGLYAGEHYDLWIADTTGSLPSGPSHIPVGPGGANANWVAQQYQSYTQTGHNYDRDAVFDATWYGVVPTAPFDIAVESYCGTAGVYWPLGDVLGTTSATDGSGNGHPLTCTSFTFAEGGLSPTDTETCALLTTSSTGTSSYVPPTPTGGFSFVALGQLTAQPGSTATVLSNLSGNNGAKLGITTGQLPFFTVGNGSATATATAVLAPVNHTTLLIGTWDGSSTVTLYSFDVTAKVGNSPVLTALAAGAPSWATGFTVGGNTLPAFLGRVGYVPACLTPVQAQTLANILFTVASSAGGTGFFVL